MFVTSSLERIPPTATAEGADESYRQIVNACDGGVRCPNSQQPSSPPHATENSTTSLPPPTKDVNSPTPVPRTSVPTPVASRNGDEEVTLNGNSDSVTGAKDSQLETNEPKIEDKDIHRTEEEINEANKDDDTKEDSEHQSEFSTIRLSPTDVSTPNTTPSSTYSRYDIYRWRERPFGPGYRRKKREEEEELTKSNGQELNGSNDKVDRFINQFNTAKTYYEDEYSYEPEQKISSMKTVIRTRSMINLDKEDEKTLFRKTLSDANLINHEVNNNSINDRTKVKQYFGFLEHPNHQHHQHEDKKDPHDLLHQLIQRRDQHKQEPNEEDRHHYQMQHLSHLQEGALRQCLRNLLVNNELVIQPRKNQPLDTPNNRRCFYHPVRINRELIDEELPDPDQVKMARDRFERVLKIKGPDVPKGLHRTASIPAGQRVTPEVRVPMTNCNTLPAKPKQYMMDKWTDSGSLSSGVSSASEDIQEEDQLHEVSSEVLQKIRACGTTVTYYGGKVIAQSRGPPSPLTSTIMEEIKFRLELRDRLMFEGYQTVDEQ